MYICAHLIKAGQKNTLSHLYCFCDWIFFFILYLFFAFLHHQIFMLVYTDQTSFKKRCLTCLTWASTFVMAINITAVTLCVFVSGLFFTPSLWIGEEAENRRAFLHTRHFTRYFSLLPKQQVWMTCVSVQLGFCCSPTWNTLTLNKAEAKPGGPEHLLGCYGEARFIAISPLRAGWCLSVSLGRAFQAKEDIERHYDFFIHWHGYVLDLTCLFLSIFLSPSV